MEATYTKSILVQPTSQEEQILIENVLKKMQIRYNIENQEVISDNHKKIIDERLQFLEENLNSLVSLETAKNKNTPKFWRIFANYFIPAAAFVYFFFAFFRNEGRYHPFSWKNKEYFFGNYFF